MNLYNSDTDKFTRGEYKGASLAMVAESDPRYILFLATSECSDEDTTLELQDYIESHPDLFEDVEVWGTPDEKCDVRRGNRDV